MTGNHLPEFTKAEWLDHDTPVVRGYRNGVVVLERPATPEETKRIAAWRPA